MNIWNVDEYKKLSFEDLSSLKKVLIYVWKSTFYVYISLAIFIFLNYKEIGILYILKIFYTFTIYSPVFL